MFCLTFPSCPKINATLNLISYIKSTFESATGM